MPLQLLEILLEGRCHGEKHEFSSKILSRFFLGILLLCAVVLPAQVVEKEIKGAAEQAGTMYADLLCMVIDPKSWEGFFDDQSAEEEAAEEAKMLKFWKTHGYAGEEQANVAIIRHWGMKKFKEGARATVQNTACEEEIAKNKFQLEETLNGPPPHSD